MGKSKKKIISKKSKKSKTVNKGGKRGTEISITGNDTINLEIVQIRENRIIQNEKKKNLIKNTNINLHNLILKKGDTLYIKITALEMDAFDYLDYGFKILKVGRGKFIELMNDNSSDNNEVNLNIRIDDKLIDSIYLDYETRID